MIMKTRLAAVLLLLLAAQASAAEIQGACEVRFLASSSMHDFSGTGKCLPFTAPLLRGPDNNFLLPLVEVEVPVAGMETGIGARDKTMRKMFQADRHPGIHAAVRDLDADALRRRMREDPGGKAPLDIVLAIRGVERKVSATAGGLAEEGSRVSFDIEFPVSLKEFELKAPKVLGIIRVADRVVVKATFTVVIVESSR